MHQAAAKRNRKLTTALPACLAASFAFFTNVFATACTLHTATCTCAMVCEETLKQRGWFASPSCSAGCTMGGNTQTDKFEKVKNRDVLLLLP